MNEIQKLRVIVLNTIFSERLGNRTLNNLPEINEIKEILDKEINFKTHFPKYHYSGDKLEVMIYYLVEGTLYSAFIFEINKEGYISFYNNLI